MKLQHTYRTENGRSAPADVTVRRLETGLGAIYRYTYEEHRGSDSLYWGALFVDGLGFVPMGKGTTALNCKVSTLAEAAEWLAVRRMRTEGEHTTAHQNSLQNALPIEDMLTHVVSATPAVIRKIKDLPCARHWVQAYSLIGQHPVFAPLEYIQGIAGTNGVGAGNCIEEAIVQGTNEIFERRAAITVVKNRSVVPTIDTSTIESPLLREQLKCIMVAGVDIVIKDL